MNFVAESAASLWSLRGDGGREILQRSVYAHFELRRGNVGLFSDFSRALSRKSATVVSSSSSISHAATRRRVWRFPLVPVLTFWARDGRLIALMPHYKKPKKTSFMHRLLGTVVVSWQALTSTKAKRSKQDKRIDAGSFELIAFRFNPGSRICADHYWDKNIFFFPSPP